MTGSASICDGRGLCHVCCICVQVRSSGTILTFINTAFTLAHGAVLCHVEPGQCRADHCVYTAECFTGPESIKKAETSSREKNKMATSEQRELKRFYACTDAYFVVFSLLYSSSQSYIME